MANISKIQVNNVDYNIKDAVARGAISSFEEEISTTALNVSSIRFPKASPHDVLIQNNKTTGSIEITSFGHTITLPLSNSGEIALKENTFRKVYYNSASTPPQIEFYSDDTTFNAGVPASGSTPICTLDASAFIKDAMVSSVAISNGNLVITWNADSGISTPTSIPLTNIFNPDNYYNKTTSDAKYLTNVSYDTTNGKIQKTLNGTTSDVVTLDSAPSSTSKKPVTSAGIHAALSKKADLDFSNKVRAYQATPTLLDAINKTWPFTPTSSDIDKTYHCSDGKIRYFFEAGGSITTDEEGRPVIDGDIVYATNIPSYTLLYFNRTDNKFYKWNGTSMEGVATSSIAESDPVFVASAAYGITSSNIITWNGKYAKPSGGIPSTDMTTAVQTSLGKADSSVQTISVNGGTATQPTNGNIDITIPSAAWEDVKPSGGIPASDLAGDIPKTKLASSVQTSLGKADSAIQGVKVNGTELTPDSNKKVNVTVPTALADLSSDVTHRLVTDAEKAAWDAKQAALTFDNVPTQSSNNPVKSGGVYSALADLYDGYDSSTETISFTFPVVS